MHGIHNVVKTGAVFKNSEHCRQVTVSLLFKKTDAAIHKGILLTMLYGTAAVLLLSVFMTNFNKGQTFFLCFLARIL